MNEDDILCIEIFKKLFVNFWTLTKILEGTMHNEKVNLDIAKLHGFSFCASMMHVHTMLRICDSLIQEHSPSTLHQIINMSF